MSVKKESPKTDNTLSRRTLFGASVAAAAVLSCEAPAAAAWKPKFLDRDQGKTLMVLCDLILPKTGTPSATEAGVHEYIDEALSVADADEQLAFLGGLGWLDRRAEERFGKALVALSEEKQTRVLQEVSDDVIRRGPLEMGGAFFDDLKRRTLFGYYTSKVGREVLGQPDKVKREKLQGCDHPGGHGTAG